ACGPTGPHEGQAYGVPAIAQPLAAGAQERGHGGPSSAHPVRLCSPPVGLSTAWRPSVGGGALRMGKEMYVTGVTGVMHCDHTAPIHDWLRDAHAGDGESLRHTACRLRHAA